MSTSLNTANTELSSCETQATQTQTEFDTIRTTVDSYAGDSSTIDVHLDWAQAALGQMRRRLARARTEMDVLLAGAVIAHTFLDAAAVFYPFRVERGTPKTVAPSFHDAAPAFHRPGVVAYSAGGASDWALLTPEDVTTIRGYAAAVPAWLSDEWTQIVAWKDAYVADPARVVISPALGASCLTAADASPPGKGIYSWVVPGGSNDRTGEVTEMQGAALWALANSDATVGDQVVTTVHTQVQEAGVDFTQSPPFCTDTLSDNPDAAVHLANWLLKLWVAYDLCREWATSAEQATINTWFTNAAAYIAAGVRAKNVHLWENPYDGEFVARLDTAGTGGDSSEPIYRGGPAAGAYGAAVNGRIAALAAFAAVAGCKLGLADAKKEAAAYFKGAVIAAVGDRWITNMHASFGAQVIDAADAAIKHLAGLSLVARAFQVAGDHSLLNYSTTKAVGATAGVSRTASLLHAAQIVTNLDRHTVALYASGHSAHVADLIDYAAGTVVSGKHAVLALVNRSYQDVQVRLSMVDSASYEGTAWNIANQTSGYKGWSGPWDVFPAPRILLHGIYISYLNAAAVFYQPAVT